MGALHLTPSRRPLPRRIRASRAVRTVALQIAALTGCDERTAVRALMLGVDKIRVARVRDEIERAMREIYAARRAPASRPEA